MRITFCKIKMERIKAEKGFTLLELILVTVVTGILSSTLILPFTSSIREGTHPEIYNTATYLTQKKIEEIRSQGYTSTSGSIGTTTANTTIKGRTYTEQVVTEYVTHATGSFSVSGTSTEFIRVTITVSNSVIPNDVTIWTILVKDFYDPDAN